MSSDAAPRVFISHASGDKDRFVLPFAEGLRSAGVDAWVTSATIVCARPKPCRPLVTPHSPDAPFSRWSHVA